jgi:hypothetical protein
VLLTSPIKGLPFRGTFHADEGFYYFRNLGDRVLLGGARNKAFEEEQTTEMHPSVKIQEALEAYLSESFCHVIRGSTLYNTGGPVLWLLATKKFPL